MSRGSLVNTFIRVARESARQQQRLEVARQRQAREQERQQARLQRELLRQQAHLDKLKKQAYLDSRLLETEQFNLEITETMAALSNLLLVAAKTRLPDPFTTLRITEQPAPFIQPPELAATQAPQIGMFTANVRPMNFFEKMFRLRKRYQNDLRKAEDLFNQAYAQFLRTEKTKSDKLNQLRSEYELATQKRLSEIEKHNADVDHFKTAYESVEPSAVTAYCSLILESSKYPEGFPHNFRLAYVSDSKELVIDYELPNVKIVPHSAEFRYVKSKDLIEEKQRKQGEIKEAYQDVVASLALRTLKELVDSDRAGHLSVLVFNGFVNTVDRSTGHDIRPYLISIRTTKERFAELDLTRIEKKACLRNLGAQVSPQPTDCQPVKPLVEFDMVDRRFVEGTDVLSDLESRPNLMELTPFEFEQVVGNLFSKMGLESKQTRASRDGGVDVVAFDVRPVIGGKVVIQAKRYRHTVGVSAVRDLFGTMNHEGANKGILVTTSSYGPDAYEFIKNKPVELIDGGGLLYLLEQHSGVKARIVFPVEE